MFNAAREACWNRATMVSALTATSRKSNAAADAELVSVMEDWLARKKSKIARI